MRLLKVFLLGLSITVICVSLHAQDETMPSFPGGSEALMQYLKDNQQTPQGSSGIVKVQFTITEIGKVENAQVIQGIDEKCNKEAKRLVLNMPDWNPGTVNGKPVSVQFALPIMFGKAGSSTRTSTPGVNSDENYQLGLKALEGENYQEALNYFDKVQSRFQSNYSFQTLEGKALILNGNIKEGCKQLKKVRKKNEQAKLLYKEHCK